MITPEHLIDRRITAPKHFNNSSTSEFLKVCEEIFRLNNKRVAGVSLDLSKVKQISLLGVLIIYKVVEYSSLNQCYHSPMIEYDDVMLGAWDKYGFTSLILTYIDNPRKVEKEYEKLKVRIGENFIIAPQPLLRDSHYTKATIREKYLTSIESYYSYNSKIVSMVFICLSEILLNFWEHASEDSKSILVASGNKSTIEIACADTGQGIISTLSEHVSESRLSKEQILLESLKKGVTSRKNTSHMGYGLWILDEIAKRTKGNLHIYSEGYFYQRFGTKVKSGETGYWKGTIVYLSLPFTNLTTLSDIIDPKSFQNLKIKWS